LVLVVPEPPLAALFEVEVWVEELSVPPGWVEVDEPVVVEVPADPPEFEPTCEEPEAPVVAEAVPVPVGVGVGVVVPAGLWAVELLPDEPDEDCPDADVPAPVLAAPDPEPCAAAAPDPDGFVEVFEPVRAVAVPVVGVEPVEVLPALVFAALPVAADADEPPEPEFTAVDVLVVVVALAEPPVVVGLGLGVGVGVCVCVEEAGPVHDLSWEPFVAVEVGVGVGDGEGVGVGVGRGVLLVDVVLVVEVVEVLEDPPLIEGFTLIVGMTVIVGE
jgi:hypothetical protein